MSSLQTTTSRRAHAEREQLHRGMRPTVLRGQLFASLRIVLLAVAALIGGLFIVAIIDVLFVLPGHARIALLIVLLTGSLLVGTWQATRPWLDRRYRRSAGEQIDHAATNPHQPVTLALSMNEPIDDDSLALTLLQRAETRAESVAKSVKPRQAYPLRRLRVQGMWLGLAGGLWLLLAVGLWLVITIIVPKLDFSLTSRVLTPWVDSPPFSLTHLEPNWTPKQLEAGSDLYLHVEPTGVEPKAVEWIRLDKDGNEAERFAMASDARGGFSHRLTRVESPIDFRLQAHGRHTRTYTITPTPKPATAEDPADTPSDRTANPPDGSTTFDPDKIARRDLDAHRDWPGIKADLKRLLQQLSDAQAQANSLDPADAEALKALAKQLAELTQKAKQLAGDVKAMQGDLPAEAAALLEDLASALSSMQSAALPAPPGASDPTATSGQPTPADWLDQVGEATRADQQRIGQGVGPSNLPTESGTASGQPDESPDIRDPNALGTYDETSVSGDAGPLPDAVMQQVPPSYRAFVAAYFEKLAEDSPKP